MQVRKKSSGIWGSLLAMGHILFRPMLVTVLNNLEIIRGLPQNKFISFSMRTGCFRPLYSWQVRQAHILLVVTEPHSITREPERCSPWLNSSLTYGLKVWISGRQLVISAMGCGAQPTRGLNKVAGPHLMWLNITAPKGIMAWGRRMMVNSTQMISAASVSPIKKWIN